MVVLFADSLVAAERLADEIELSEPTTSKGGEPVMPSKQRSRGCSKPTAIIRTLDTEKVSNTSVLMEHPADEVQHIDFNGLYPEIITICPCMPSIP